MFGSWLRSFHFNFRKKDVDWREAVHWIKSWAILSKDEAMEQLKVGAHLLEVQALSFFSMTGGNIFRALLASGRPIRALASDGSMAVRS
jgi:hypothetical protein